MIDLEPRITRGSSKLEALLTLRDLLPIPAVIDVGVREGTSDLVRAFPDVTHYLFDPLISDF